MYPPPPKRRKTTRMTRMIVSIAWYLAGSRPELRA
jgi:hypothetical protein